MKIRNGFVSNSSSSSFVVKKADLTANQIWAILNYADVYDWFCNVSNMHKDPYFDGEAEEWTTFVYADEIRGDTFLDNFDMKGFMKVIGVDINKVEFDLNDENQYEDDEQ